MALFDRSRARATVALTLGEGGVERVDALPEGLGIPRLVATDAGSFDVVGDAPALQRVAYSASEGAERELLPAVGRIVVGAARAPDGRVDVLLARGGPLPIPLHLASRALDGTWSSREVGASPWSYAGLSADGAGRPVAGWCAFRARSAVLDLVSMDGAGARRTVLPGARCGDQPIAAAASGDAPVFGIRANDIHLAVAGRDGRYVDLRVAGTAPLSGDACVPAALGPEPGEGRCTARGAGTTGLALTRTGRGVWLAYLAVTLDTDFRIERRCHPVDPAGRHRPPPSCDDARTPTEDRSEASLVVAQVDASAVRATVTERLRVPLGRMPSLRNVLLVAAAGEVLHAIVATDAGGVSALRYVTVDLPTR